LYTKPDEFGPSVHHILSKTRFNIIISSKYNRPNNVYSGSPQSKIRVFISRLHRVSEKVKYCVWEEAWFRLSFRVHTPQFFFFYLTENTLKKRQNKPEVEGMLDTTVTKNEIFLRNYKPTIYVLQTLQDKILSKGFILTLKMRRFHIEHDGTLHDVTGWC
jgi:hypothetical protein